MLLSCRYRFCFCCRPKLSGFVSAGLLFALHQDVGNSVVDE